MPTLTPPSAPLERLQGDIARLRRRRSVVRIGSALAVVVLLLIAALIAAFAVDYLIDLSPIQRAIAFLGIAAATVWIIRRTTGTWSPRSESDTEVALEVGRRHGLAGDLLAAFQFQSNDAKNWGSQQLEQAVIDDVSEASRDLNVFDGFRWTPLPKRALSAAVAIASITLLAITFPQHAQLFAKRLLLADVSYPTRTVINSLTINGKLIDLTDRKPLFIPAGAPVEFVATAGGAVPNSGSVMLRGNAGGETNLALRPQTESAPQFAGAIEALTETITYRISLGDAKTPPRRIELVPRPAVTIDLVPTPPAYAASNAPDPPPPGVRTAYILAGSSVEIVIRSANKPLAEVSTQVRHVTQSSDRGDNPKLSAAAATVEKFTPSADRRTWSLNPTGTPFENVQTPLTFEVKAVDDDSLMPAEPIVGTLKLRADRPPRVTASAVVRHVLPNGQPTIVYGATDDFGIDAMQASLTITKSDGTQLEPTQIPLPINRTSTTEVEGRHSLDLAMLSLATGDRVTVRIEAVDARGDRAGETGAAEPLILEVTDRAGLLAKLREADELGAEQLDAIIRRELGIGGER